jgi:hypothetical protein
MGTPKDMSNADLIAAILIHHLRAGIDLGRVLEKGEAGEAPVFSIEIPEEAKLAEIAQTASRGLWEGAHKVAEAIVHRVNETEPRSLFENLRATAHSVKDIQEKVGAILGPTAARPLAVTLGKR